MFDNRLWLVQLVETVEVVEVVKHFEIRNSKFEISR